MSYKEKDIIHETNSTFVLKEKDAYTVYRIGLTHSTSDSSYKLDKDGLNLAIYRANYINKTNNKELLK